MTEQTRKAFLRGQRRMLVTTIIGYTLFYFLRKNLSLAMPGLAQDYGITKTTLGIFLTLHGVVDATCGDAFRAVFDVACRMGDEGAAFFRQRAKQIPSNWHAARQQALDHGCEDRAYVETVKLNAAECIMAKFESLLEAKQ